MKSRTRVLAIALGVAGLLTVSIPAALADSECPGANYELLDVDTLTGEGYIVPAEVDATGNDDGSVCGLALPAAAWASLPIETHPDVLYVFRDNRW
jgi:hypothetical protein